MSMQYPEISVIVPIYNAESYLCKCIDSLLAQTFDSYEILLIDDGSPDKSGEICDKYALINNKVRVFHKENGGVSSARQYGLDSAKGKYIIHTDPDDYVEKDMLSELYARAVDTNADMVICDYYLNQKEGQTYIKQEPSSTDCKTVISEMFWKLHGSCCNKLVKKTVFTQFNICFPNDLFFCEDMYVNIAILLHDIHISYLGKAFYHYCVNSNPNSITNNYNSETYKYECMLLDKFKKLLGTHACIDIAIESMSYSIVKRAFYSNIFSNKEFKDNCYRFRKYVFFAKRTETFKSKVFSFLMYASCCGFYKIAFSIYNLYERINKI